MRFLTLCATVAALCCCGCGSIESSMGTRRDNGTVRAVTHGKVRIEGITIHQAAGAKVPALSVVIGETSPTFADTDQGGASAQADGNQIGQ
jgi:hypothetical protein